MVLVPVHCSVFGHDHIAKRGKTELGKQRYLCQNPKCPVKTFILDYDDHGCVPNVKKKISNIAKIHDIVIGLFINRYEFGVLV
jgi:hypothetical protein